MFTVKKSSHNPLLSPNTNDPWEAKAVFNWCPIKDGNTTHYVYRAMSSNESYFSNTISISSIGYTSSLNEIDFSETKQLIAPEYEWERYGCEDPRVTKIDDKFYIFYTALSNYPFDANSIKIAVAITKDFKTIEEKHLVTPFNAKAMALFPEKINGKYVVILSVNTDMPPAKICFAEFDNLEDIWNEKYWQKWYKEFDKHSININRSDKDHVEVGAVPIKTDKGWLLIYSHIENYFRDNNPSPRVFGIEALLLDLHDTKKIIGRTKWPIVTPSEIYEKNGQFPDIVFPSGALIDNENLNIYYGASDTFCCKVTVNLKNLLSSMHGNSISEYTQRYKNNPILKPRSDFKWESHGVFNPAVLQIGKNIHILYRAMSNDDTSYIGYALTTNGYDIIKREDNPIYIPRESFENKRRPGNSGCEDPRLTLIDKKVYMCYTAYDGENPPRVALTYISLKDFEKNNWNWSKPVLISPVGKDDKDACIFPEKINGKYLVLHRINGDICADYVKSLDFPDGPLEISTPIILPRAGMWDSEKIGISSPPIKTKKGWLLIYHGVSSQNHIYRVGAALLDLKNPLKVLSRTTYPILEPETDYEKIGIVPNVVFPCGACVRGDDIFMYYGGADDVVAVATVSLEKVLQSLL